MRSIDTMRSRWNPCGVQLPFRERWPRRSAAVVGLLVLTLCAPAATETATGAARASPVLKLHQVVEQLVKDGAPGAIVVVRTPSGVRRAAAGLARIRPRVTMAPSDRFRIASITKTFVATVALQLAAEGRLRLADPVDRWVPGLVPEGRSITLRELLDHTSGLYDYTADREWTAQRIAHPGRTWTPRELVRVAARHKLLFRPGTDWYYSNTNYVLLGLVVEAAARASLGDELRERIFRPLRLDATSFPSGSSIPGRVAHGYLGSLRGLPIPPRAARRRHVPGQPLVVGSRPDRLDRRRRDRVPRGTPRRAGAPAGPARGDEVQGHDHASGAGHHLSSTPPTTASASRSSSHRAERRTATTETRRAGAPSPGRRATAGALSR